MPSYSFSVHHILVELKVSPLDKTADVQLTLISVGHPETALKLKLYVLYFQQALACSFYYRFVLLTV